MEMPLGQLMLTFTSTARLDPSRRDLSIRGYWPHSVQNRYLHTQRFIHAAHAHNKRQEVRVTQISPFLRMYSNGPRFVQSLGDDHISKRAIQSGHLNHIKALVCPIDVSYSRQEQDRFMDRYWDEALKACESAQDTPAIQSTAMPSTRPMPLVMTSSLHVWSLLALLMVLKPMSTQ